MADERLARWLSHIYETDEGELDCSALQAHLPAFVDHEFDREEGTSLSAEQNRLIHLHLDHCPDCREIYRGLREVVGLGRAGELPTAEDCLEHFEESQSEVAGCSRASGYT